MNRPPTHPAPQRGAVATGQPIGPELLTIPEAARRLGVGARQLRRAVKRGELSVYQVGGWPRVRWRDVDQWVTRQRVSATPHARSRVAEILADEARSVRDHGR